MTLAHRSVLPALAVALLCAAGLPAVAEEAERSVIVPHDPPIGDTGRSFRAATRWVWPKNPITYIDRVEGPIPMDGAPAFERPEPRTPQRAPFEVPTTLLLPVLLGLIALAVWAFAGPGRGLFARPPRASQPEAAPETAAPGAQLPVELSALRGLADREAALRLLLEGSLDRAAAANALRRSRSETARETLRRVPRGWVHRDALRRIVMAEEMVGFAGRELTEATLDAAFAAAGPIWQGARP